MAAKVKNIDATQLGKTALTGWREKAASGVAGPVSSRSPLNEDQVRALVGALFFFLSVYYVANTIRRAMKEA